MVETGRVIVYATAVGRGSRGSRGSRVMTDLLGEDDTVVPDSNRCAGCGTIGAASGSEH